jgi:hypothetical protein
MGGLPSKTDRAGLDDRLDVLEEVDPAVGGELRSFVEERRDGGAMWHRRIQSGRLDDIVDAAVLALTASTSHPEYATLPEGADPERPPVMVYPDVD